MAKICRSSTYTGLWVAMVAAAALTGCGGDNPTTSTVKGTIAKATFTSAVKNVSILHEDGARSSVPVTGSGAFTLTLGKGTYRMFLSDDGKGTPLVIKTDDAGRLETELEVQSGGAAVDMGSVRFWPGTTVTHGTRSGAITTTPDPGACVAGAFEGTGMPCASGTAVVACQDVEEEDDDDDGDHECEDGIDPNGNSCDGGPAANQNDSAEAETANDADPSAALAVSQLNLPEKIGCGEGDDEEEGDD